MLYDTGTFIPQANVHPRSGSKRRKGSIQSWPIYFPAELLSIQVLQSDRYFRHWYKRRSFRRNRQREARTPRCAEQHLADVLNAQPIILCSTLVLIMQVDLTYLRGCDQRRQPVDLRKHPGCSCQLMKDSSQASNLRKCC